jgi:tRNA (mo5U34)-methyltransferase
MYPGEAAGAALSRLNRGQLLEKMKSLPWVHAIDVGGGVTTPGTWGKGNPEVYKACDQIDFSRKRVLDIGCWDGMWSFEAERRGAAEVVGTDLVDQRPNAAESTLRVAAALRSSQVRYVPSLSVYEIEKLGKKFDIILYLGVFYHLKDPLRSFTSLRRVLKNGGSMIVEGAVLNDPGCFANFYYREPFYGDYSNWWVPTRDCLRQWVECSFMKITWEGAPFGDAVNQRHSLLAQAVKGKDPLYQVEPEYLEEFNF